MKILALEDGFPPELAPARLASELWQEMAARGHEVTVVTSFPRRRLLPAEQVSIPRGKLFYWEQIGKVSILRIGPQFKGKSTISLALEHTLLPIMLFLGGIITAKKDIIHCQSPPLILAVAAAVISKLRRTPFILRIQDVHPDALIKIGLVKNSFLIKCLEILEGFAYRCANHITVIAEGYRQLILVKGIKQERVSLIPNWANIKRLEPTSSGGDFRKSFGLTNEFVVTYAGTMSLPQDLETVIESANLLKHHHKEVVFLLVGEGVKKGRLVVKARELGLKNVIFMPLQPQEVYFNILRSSDACFVLLKKSYTSPTAPSKILDMMACAKPILASVPYKSDVYDIVNEAECGLWIEPENPEAMSQVILTLHRDRNLAKQLGRNGRDFAKRNLTLSACADKYEALLCRFGNKKVKNSL